MPISAAEVGLTGWEVQDAPPLTVVRTTPRPVRVPVTVLAVVPTATHQAPVSPAGAVVVVVAGGGGAVVVGLGPEVVVDPAVVVDPGAVAAVPWGVVVAAEVVVVVVDVKGRPCSPGAPRKQAMPFR
jgi:hypothetical protein